MIRVDVSLDDYDSYAKENQFTGFRFTSKTGNASFIKEVLFIKLGAFLLSIYLLYTFLKYRLTPGVSTPLQQQITSLALRQLILYLLSSDPLYFVILYKHSSILYSVASNLDSS